MRGAIIMAKYESYSTEFKLQLVEFYQSHTWRETATKFNLDETLSNKALISKWNYKHGFLPKSSGRNPSPKRAMVQPKLPKSKINFIVKSGGFIMKGKFYGKTEFAKVQKDLKIGDTFKVVTVTEHVVGIMNA